MTLQTSGQISISDLATEFGGTAPHSLNEYYRGGGLVPDTGTNAGIPTSGQIQLDDFYGGSVVSGPQPGELWTWGRNKYGSALDGTYTTRSSPAQEISGSSNWADIGFTSSPCCDHIVTLKSDGRLWGWGNNNQGAMGTGSTIPTQLSSPVQTVAGGTNWEKVAPSGGDQPTAIKSDGRLWGWGSSNSDGGLGTNDASPRYSPIQTVSGGTNWEFVSRSSGIKTDGRLWLWGNGGNGVLGTNNATSRSSPVQTVTGGTNWVAGDRDYFDALFIKSDGRLWGWGENLGGQLGTNDASPRSSPIQTITSGTDWENCSANSSSKYSLAIKTDGRLWVWGANLDGFLGINDRTPRSSPIQTVAGGTNWRSMYAGFLRGSGIKTDGRLWVWGGNGNGALGTNAAVGGVSSPVQTAAGGTTWQRSRIGHFAACIRT